jgi:TolB protein
LNARRPNAALGSEVSMQKSRLPLLILLLVLACVLCLCAAVTGFAVFQVIRTVTDVELPQMQALVPPAPALASPELPLQPEITPLPLASRASASVDRIVAQGEDGTLYTVRPDGTDRISLTKDSAGLRVYRQPTWSPDARRIAWVEIEGGDDGLKSALVTGRADGSDATRADTADRPPFYLAWSPDGARLAALSGWDEGLALRSLDVARGGTEASVLARGQPLYFAWSPDSTRLIAHLNGERVSLVSGKGDETELDTASARFGAPDWLSDGAAFVYAQRIAGASRLVLADPSGATLRDLAEIDGAVSFSVSPRGERVAFIDTTERAPTAAFGPLSVADVSGRAETVLVDDGPVLAFFWSPQGDKIAYLIPGDRPAEGPRASLSPTFATDHLNLWLQWRVWDGERSFDLSQFRPSDTFLIDYLRFFDQYARSMTPWAPDGSAFVFAGESEDTIPGVWVQQAEEGADPVLIGDGVYAAWSPR